MENDKQKTISASKSVFEKTEGGMVRERGFSPQERTRRAVHATGNRWAIENFDATHN